MAQLQTPEQMQTEYKDAKAKSDTTIMALKEKQLGQDFYSPMTIVIPEVYLKFTDTK